jgi:hypothetical protein
MKFEPSIEESHGLLMRYGDSLSSLSLASSYTGGISLFSLRLRELNFLGSRVREYKLILVHMRRAFLCPYAGLLKGGYIITTRNFIDHEIL